MKLGPESEAHTDSWQFGKLAASAGLDVEEAALCKKSPIQFSICKMDTWKIQQLAYASCRRAWGKKTERMEKMLDFSQPQPTFA